jgi:flagellar biosynthesis protein FlhG
MGDQADGLRALARQGRLGASVAVRRRAQAAGPRTIAISSGKGGVGKTSVAINLGLALGQLGRRVVLLDADLGLANLDVMLGLRPKHHLGHVVSGERTIADILVQAAPNVAVIPGGSGLGDLVDLPRHQRDSLIRSFTLLDRLADILIIDTAAGVSSDVSSFVLAASELVVVTTPDPAAITDAYALVKVVTGLGARPRIRLLVNQVSGSAEADEVALKLAGVARRFLGVDVGMAGFIPADPHLAQAARKQSALLALFPAAPASRKFADVARLLASDLATAPPTQSDGFWRQVLTEDAPGAAH